MWDDAKIETLNVSDVNIYSLSLSFLCSWKMYYSRLSYIKKRETIRFMIFHSKYLQKSSRSLTLEFSTDNMIYQMNKRILIFFHHHHHCREIIKKDSNDDFYIFRWTSFYVVHCDVLTSHWFFLATRSFIVSKLRRHSFTAKLIKSNVLLYFFYQAISLVSPATSSALWRHHKSSLNIFAKMYFRSLNIFDCVWKFFSLSYSVRYE